MAPRADALPFPAVAVKCDLCKGAKEGPACVAACPVEAIARIDPNEVLLGPAQAEVFPARTAAWPWLVGAALAGLGLAAMNAGRWTTGAALAPLLLVLIGYAGAKRIRRMPPKRYLYIAHMSLAIVALGVAVAHVGPHVPSSLAGALTLALLLAVLTGAFGGAAGALVPRTIARIERKAVLPEELSARGAELDAQVFRTLSGKSELVKTLFVKSLRPYLRSRVGPLHLVASQRSLRDEEKRLRSQLDALTGKPKSEPALDALIKLVVEHRAVRAQRWLTWLLRGWLVPHLAATVAVIVLVILHIVGVGR